MEASCLTRPSIKHEARSNTSPRFLGTVNRSSPNLVCAVWCLAAGLTAVTWFSVATVVAGETDSGGKPSDQTILFEQHVLPIFKANCTRCHNDTVTKAELDLSSPQGVFKGGESGAVVTPGKVEESLLYDMVHEGYMPPEEDKTLSAADIATIKAWIASGARLQQGSPQELIAASEVSNHDIEPLLLLRCAVCHGGRTKEAELDVRTKESLLRGGRSGPAIVLGKPDQSLILQKIHAGEMPPRKRLIEAGVFPFSASEIEQLTRWIELGAPEIEMQPDVATTEPDPLVSDEDRQFWSFQPPRPVAAPTVQARERVHNPIDAFLLARLEQAGLAFAPEADRLTLLRRASFDLTGLPPSPEDIERYLADEVPGAYERMIERLLNSPQYGERWARHWLDAAGYADSEGKRSQDPIRPNTYKYRDYVVRAFNSDKPYDRFLLEQIAGDELVNIDAAPEVTAEMVDNLVATGFLRLAPDGTGSDVVNRVPERLEVIADEIDIFSTTVLGLTMKCARCHSHKYDPIPQRDYYRLAAIFKGALDEHDWLKPTSVPGQSKNQKPGRVLSVAAPAELAEMAANNRKIDEQIAAEKRRLTDLAEQLQQQGAVGEGGLDSLPQYRNMKDRVNLLVKALESQRQTEPQIRALWDRGEPTPTYVYRRGDYLQPARLVGPGVPSMLTDGKTPFAVQPPWPGAAKTGRRLALARWLIQPDHPLTSRVMVNRIWHHHFGRGIVASIDNFGKLGTPPSHPELLDWLAIEFVRQDWSIKAMHRLMMTSSAYRQSSRVENEVIAADPQNELLSRMPLRRLDAEELNDGLLAVSGRLAPQMFGRPDPVNVRGDGLVTPREVDGGWRRSLYVLHRRKEIPTVLETFDQPAMNPNCVQRVSSTVAQQALYLWNDARVRELSASFAARVAAEADNPTAQVERAILLAFGRPASSEERNWGVQALADLTEAWQRRSTSQDGNNDNTANPNTALQQALVSYCHTLLNSAEFLYVD